MSASGRAAFAAIAASALAAAVACNAPGAAATARPLVVIVTPSEAVAPDEFRGAEAMVRSYSAQSAKGDIRHAILPEPKAGVASFIADAASDPRVKALVVDPSPAGCAEGIRRAKRAKPGLIAIAGGSREDELAIEASADLVVDLDRASRAYLIPWAAKKMGAKALVAAYSRGAEDDPAQVRERAIMSAACADLGLKYAAVTAPTGTDPVVYARAMTGAWLRDYGPDASLYCSDGALVAPLLAGSIAGGGIVVDEAGEATRAAYAAALGIDLSPAKGDAARERRLLERALGAVGGRGRFGEWDAGYAGASVEGIAEFALRIVTGSARKDDLKAFVAALESRSPGAAWLASFDVDPDTGVRSANRALLRQDVYVFGSGYLQTALQNVPGKYLSLSN